MADEFPAKCGEQAEAGALPQTGSMASGMSATGASEASNVTEAETKHRAFPPVEQWNPPFGGDIDMRIARDGTWFYGGTAITRPALVRLFSTILRKDPDRYVLVTPVEKFGIRVEDAPFLAVQMIVAEPQPDQILRFLTNVGDWVEAGHEHALRFENAAFGGMKPYIHVRGDLWALATRAVFLDLAELCDIRENEGARWFGVTSAGHFFPMARAEEADAIEADGSR